MTPTRTRTRRSPRRTAVAAAVAAMATVAVGVTVLAAPAAAGPPVPASGTLTWSITPSPPNYDTEPTGTFASAGLAGSTSIEVFAVEQLEWSVNTVAAELDANVPAGSEAAVDVRGKRADGVWSEWIEITPDAAAVLPETTSSVQVRLVLVTPEGTTGPDVNRIDMTAWNAGDAATTRSMDAAQPTFRVFATREDLAGGTTANGHVIVNRDHFVALPSRRGLAARSSGNYSVQVCTSDNARCEWAPVWDVGPWNTKDDYWNADRENWTDLPQGTPQAQAAYQDDYNGGKDQFGRTVANPAGIDLADGTFWDGLKLSDNAWVNVTYEWTGYGPWGTIATASTPLNVRSAPLGSAPQVGLAARHAQVRIECQVSGERVTGTQGTSNLWYRLASGKYIARAYVSVGSAPAAC